jgi:hypothetical protein
MSRRWRGLVTATFSVDMPSRSFWPDRRVVSPMFEIALGGLDDFQLCIISSIIINSS